MVIGYVILALFVLAFVGALCGWIKVRLEYDKEREAAGYENYDETYEALKKKHVRVLLSRICAGCLAAIFIMAVFLILISGPTKDNAEPTTVPTTIETVPETVAETTECTTAPDTVETSIPETTEPIHIETQPTTPPQPTRGAISGENNTDEGMSELEMLACVIYQEAGGNGSCDNCRRYVADIVLNRVEHPDFPNTMYEVLTARGQYGKFYWTGIKWPARAEYESEAFAVERAYKVAEEVLSGQHSELYGNGYIWQAGFAQGTDGFWCCGHFYGR